MTPVTDGVTAPDDLEKRSLVNPRPTNRWKVENRGNCNWAAATCVNVWWPWIGNDRFTDFAAYVTPFVFGFPPPKGSPSQSAFSWHEIPWRDLLRRAKV